MISVYLYRLDKYGGRVDITDCVYLYRLDKYGGRVDITDELNQKYLEEQVKISFNKFINIIIG